MRFLRTVDASDPNRPRNVYQLRVEHDSNGELSSLTDVYEACMSSRRTNARVAEVFDKVSLTDDQVRWLYRALGDLIAEQDREANGDPPLPLKARRA